MCFDNETPRGRDFIRASASSRCADGCVQSGSNVNLLVGSLVLSRARDGLCLRRSKWRCVRFMLHRLMLRLTGADFSASKAVIEERYASLRKQVPIVYLLGFVNLAGLELATRGRISPGVNLPSFIALCGLIRMWQWFRVGSDVTQEVMIKRMRQTVWFATLVCGVVCFHCLQLLGTGDTASRMAVMLFGGLTAIGVAYGLTALPGAGIIPLLLIIIPISIVALVSDDVHIIWAALGLVTVSGLTIRLLLTHSRHLTALINSRSLIAHEQDVANQAHREAMIAATTDFLTGLLNRRAFVSALEDMVKDQDGAFAIALLDLDRFKITNDTFGHATGDELLCEVAARLVRIVGSNGLVARLGGDEFGIILPKISRAAEAQAFGSEILFEVNQPVMVGDRKLAISACCGFGLSRRGRANSPSRLMADADIALYRAKESPEARAAVFELRMEAPHRRRCQIERALQAPGIERRLRLCFQPIVDLKSGRVIAHEALARWTDEELGPVSPAEFVPIAEQLNLIENINDHLMRMAFSEARAWPDNIRLSFNLSAVQLHSNVSAKAVLKALKAAGLPASRLQVEVTETALLADFERARANLNTLRAAGVLIVLDDFGAGFASIGYLRELQFDQIKLDGGLVTAALGSSDGKRLLAAVIALCGILGVSSVAEHIESEEALELLKELGCSAGQGFWLKRPVGPDEVRSTLFAAALRAA